VAGGTPQKGAGPQTGYNRWGDYTDMSVDPVDDTTFWYVNEYYSSSSPDGWATAIGSFKLPSSCVQAPPTVALTAPPAGSYVHGTVTITANASDQQTVANVQFKVDNTFLATVTTPPYQAPWDTTTASTGAHTISATATDGAGLTATDSRVVEVDNTPPTVALTSPVAGANVSGTVQMAASASDVGSGGTVAKVDFLVDGNVVATSTAAPYTANWVTTTYANGTHTVAARATDLAGNVTTTAAVSVTVQNVNSRVLHIASMNGYGQLRSSTWRAWADVTVVDQNGKAVAGVTVTFTFTGGTAATRTCTTNTSGYCSTSGNKVTVPLPLSETVVTTKAVKSGWTWNGVKYGVVITPP
jgi:Bacterial Ig domain